MKEESEQYLFRTRHDRLPFVLKRSFPQLIDLLADFDFISVAGVDDVEKNTLGCSFRKRSPELACLRD